jgi:hypothetical protein
MSVPLSVKMLIPSIKDRGVAKHVAQFQVPISAMGIHSVDPSCLGHEQIGAGAGAYRPILYDNVLEPASDVFYDRDVGRVAQ